MMAASSAMRMRRLLCVVTTLALFAGPGHAYTSTSFGGKTYVVGEICAMTAAVMIDYIFVRSI
jgi:hypothetical protein